MKYLMIGIWVIDGKPQIVTRPTNIDYECGDAVIQLTKQGRFNDVVPEKVIIIQDNKLYNDWDNEHVYSQKTFNERDNDL